MQEAVPLLAHHRQQRGAPQRPDRANHPRSRAAPTNCTMSGLQGALSGQREAGRRRWRFIDRQRDLRSSGKGRRPLRRRRQRDQRHRHRARCEPRCGLRAWTHRVVLPVLIGLIARRAGLRFPQRPARCRQLDRHHRLDPRAAAAICGGLGGVLQFHRLPVLRPACRARRIGTGIVDADVVDARVIFGALMGAIVLERRSPGWLGIPSSSSHALIGGLVGAGIAKAGVCGDRVGAA